MPLTLTIVEPADLARCAADVLAHHLALAIGETGRASIALSGGSTPSAAFKALSAIDLAWGAVDIFQVDERVAPDGSGIRNATDLRAALLDRIAISDSHVHLMDTAPSATTPLSTRADRYSATLQRVAPHGLDVVHLGLGDDGHTASLTPTDRRALRVRDRLATTTMPYRGARRMTLTFPALEQARHIVWIVTGASKAERVRQLLDGDKRIPAGRLFHATHTRRQRHTLVLDEPAAQLVRSDERATFLDRSEDAS